MNNNRSPVARRIGYFGVLTIVASLTGCYTPRPVMVMPPPYAPPVIVQTAPPVQYAPVQTAPSAHVQQAQQLTDPQIAGIMIEANNSEIREARLALSISHNPRVRAFAQRMINDHTRLNTAMQLAANRMGITPVQSPTSQNLSATARQAYSQLSAMRGSQFNRTYITHQVGTHTTVLNGIDRFLLPNARSPRLLAILRQARPVIAAHLQHAKQLQATLR